MSPVDTVVSLPSNVMPALDSTAKLSHCPSKMATLASLKVTLRDRTKRAMIADCIADVMIR